MAIRLIAIDIDGTLMPSAGSSVSERNCAALRAAEASGLMIVIATGRRHLYAAPLIANIGLDREALMISSNGAVIRRLNGELIERSFLSLEAARRLCAELREYGTVVFTFDREGPAGLVIEYLHKLHGRIAKWVDANRAHLTEIRPIERAFDRGEAPIQGMVCGTLAEMKEAEARLLSSGFDRQIGIQRTEYGPRDLSILDLLPLGVSKGTALFRLAQIKNLKPEEIVAIGDNFNDLEMLEFAGHPVVMENAGPEMLAIARERGWAIAASNDKDGVAQVVEAILRAAAPASSGGSGGNAETAKGGRPVVEWAQ